MPSPENLNQTGGELLGFVTRISTSREQIGAAKQNIKEAQSSFFNALDKDKLLRGELTGDRRLDAALLLAEKPRFFPDYFSNSLRAYERIKDEEQKVKEWSGGVVMVDSTIWGPWPCIQLAVVPEPVFDISFSGEKSNPVSISIGKAYNSLILDTEGYHAYVKEPVREMDGKELEITSIFGLSAHRANRFYDGVSLYLGNESVEQGMNKITSAFYAKQRFLRPYVGTLRELYADFVTQTSSAPTAR